ncbi:hypothetical protein LX36DRAFT_462764 [Colletotrichum falcatum]|nr:hypothetical protein LX36DRAFT_462764 [Colletotrichum falcatum]
MPPPPPPSSVGTFPARDRRDMNPCRGRPSVENSALGGHLAPHLLSTGRFSSSQRFKSDLHSTQPERLMVRLEHHTVSQSVHHLGRKTDQTEPGGLGVTGFPLIIYYYKKVPVLPYTIVLLPKRSPFFSSCLGRFPPPSDSRCPLTDRTADTHFGTRTFCPPTPPPPLPHSPAANTTQRQQN